MKPFGQPFDLFRLRDGIKAEKGRAATRPKRRRTLAAVPPASIVVEVAPLARRGLAQVVKIAGAHLALVSRRVDLDDRKHHVSPSGGPKSRSNSSAALDGSGSVDSAAREARMLALRNCAKLCPRFERAASMAGM